MNTYSTNSEKTQAKTLIISEKQELRLMLISYLPTLFSAMVNAVFYYELGRNMPYPAISGLIFSGLFFCIDMCAPQSIYAMSNKEDSKERAVAALGFTLIVCCGTLAAFSLVSSTFQAQVFKFSNSKTSIPQMQAELSAISEKELTETLKKQEADKWRTMIFESYKKHSRHIPKNVDYKRKGKYCLGDCIKLTEQHKILAARLAQAKRRDELKSLLSKAKINFIENRNGISVIRSALPNIPQEGFIISFALLFSLTIYVVTGSIPNWTRSYINSQNGVVAPTQDQTIDLKDLPQRKVAEYLLKTTDMTQTAIAVEVTRITGKRFSQPSVHSVKKELSTIRAN